VHWRKHLALKRQPAGFKQGRSPPTAAIPKQGPIVSAFRGLHCGYAQKPVDLTAAAITLMLLNTCPQLLAAPSR
jgi:hypothetical protein